MVLTDPRRKPEWLEFQDRDQFDVFKHNNARHTISPRAAT